jgi:hypothetical protein
MASVFPKVIVKKIEEGAFNNDLKGPIVYTTTPLDANQSFTSDLYSTSGYGKIVGTVYTDQDGVLLVGQSPDGTNIDCISRFEIIGGGNWGFVVDVVAPYFGIKYINGSVAQTVFRLYVFLRRV